MRKFVLGLVVFLISTIWLSAQADNETCYNQGGYVDVNTGKCTIEGGFTLKTQYPTEFIQYENIQGMIDDFILGQRQDFIDLYISSQDMVMYPWYLDISYEIYPYSDANEITTVIFTIADYAGGAHGNYYYYALTFDLTTDSVIPLEDFFVEGTDILSIVYPLALADLNAQFADLGIGETWLSEDMINFMDFIITEDTLTFLFEPYTAGPWAAGAFEVAIPLSELGDVLAR